MALHAKVLTISDAAASGERADASGPALERRLADAGYAVVERRIVADGVEVVAGALRAMAAGFSGLLVTSGGTGFGPRDLTPEATRTVLEREAPGLAEATRHSSALGPLSRGIAGTLGGCLVLNLPGSTSGALESLEAVIGLLPHALDLLGGGRPH